jgi:parvulin-like peptidyl-prolyl isomerase
MKRKLILLIVLLAWFGWYCSDQSRREKKAQEKREADIQARKAEARELDRKTILSINNKTFSNLDFKQFIEKQYSNLNSIQEKKSLLSRIFDMYIEQELIFEKIETANVNLDDVEVKEFLNTLQIDEDFQSDLIRDNLKIQKYLYFTLYNNITVSESEIRNYYNSHKNEFIKDDEVLLHQIVVKDKDKSTQISGMLKNFPEKFEETARNQSESSEAKKNGLMGYFERGSLPKEMENVVFSLKVNEISPVVESPYGYHIFKITRRRGKRTLYLSNAREEIKKKILAEKMHAAFATFLKEVRVNAHMKVFYQNLFFEYVPIKGEKNDETN